MLARAPLSSSSARLAPASRPGAPASRPAALTPPRAASAASGPTAGMKELAAAVVAATGVTDKVGAAAARAVLDSIEDQVRGKWGGVSISLKGWWWWMGGWGVRRGAGARPIAALKTKNACPSKNTLAAVVHAHTLLLTLPPSLPRTHALPCTGDEGSQGDRAR